MNQQNTETHLELHSLIKKIADKNYFDSEDNWQTIEELIQKEEFKFLLQHISGFMYIFNYQTGQYEYFSDNIKSELGYDPQMFQGEDGARFIYSKIPENQGPILTEKIMPAVLVYISQNSTIDTGRDFRFTCCLKFKNIKEEYKWFLLDTNIIQADKNGFPVRSIVTCTNINDYKRDEVVYYTVLKKDETGIYQSVLQGHVNENIEETKLTKREVEIVKLIGLGNTNTQIAEKLFISLNTVETHRKNILKKTQCKGTAELTNFAFSRGII